ncbi:MAG: hypothetical protein P1U32_00955 [Legionellaceae bacterium]|nr:hypothetical protein [Legionellaceae bacterium]
MSTTLADKTEFDDLVTLIRDTNAHIEGKLTLADQAQMGTSHAALERTEKALQFMEELLAYYEREDTTICNSLRADLCDIQPPLYPVAGLFNITFTPWWWKDLRDGEEAFDVLNRLFKKWVDNFEDRKMLADALIQLKQLGDQVKARIKMLQEELNTLRVNAGEDAMSGVSDAHTDIHSAWLWQKATEGLSFLQRFVVPPEDNQSAQATKTPEV